MVTDHENGWWTIKKPSQEWLAWNYWRKTSLSLRFMAETMTVTSRWPPSDAASANQYAALVNAVFEKKGYAKRVPPTPHPWAGTIPPFVKERDPTPGERKRVSELIHGFMSSKKTLQAKAQTFDDQEGSA